MSLTVEDSDAKKFNFNLIQLLEQLGKFYPDDRDIQIYRDKIVILSKANAKLPSEMYLLFCADHIEEIMTFKESFFIEFNYHDRVSDPKYLKLIEKIISLWKESKDEKMKKMVSQYLQVLLAHSIKCMKRSDLLDIINKFRKTPLTM
jgi:hypothetical protein